MARFLNFRRNKWKTKTLGLVKLEEIDMTFSRIFKRIYFNSFRIHVENKNNIV